MEPGIGLEPMAFSSQVRSHDPALPHPQDRTRRPSQLTDGWNYAVRQYQSQQPILDGSWVFPKPTLA